MTYPGFTTSLDLKKTGIGYGWKEESALDFFDGNHLGFGAILKWPPEELQYVTFVCFVRCCLI